MMTSGGPMNRPRPEVKYPRRVREPAARDDLPAGRQEHVRDLIASFK
jgi:hypothetical protein